jgi:glyoxylase-like metal-dependent hydrolase (beta-lactamase superfamily II)
MRSVVSLLTAVVLLMPLAAHAQTLQDVARALGADTVKSLEIQGSGSSFLAGQSVVPGQPWPQFNVKSLTQLVNYETGSLREEAVRIRALEPPRGGGAYVRGEQRQIFVVSGDHAWNVVNDAPVPAPIALADRQFQLWSTPHGMVKAALAGRGTMQGRTIAIAVPGRFKATATVGVGNLVEKIDATVANAVLGDMPVTIAFADYKDFGGVKFPTKIRQTSGGFPSVELTVTEVKANVAADIPVPDPVRQAGNPYARVASTKVVDGVFYIAGGSHHSVAIEMQDHVIVAEAPLNEARALAVLAEVRTLIPGKPIRYVIVSHHHFDHSGGVRTFAGEGITVVTHEASKPFFERVIALPATVNPDHLAKSGKKAAVEGVRDKRVFTDGTRTVEVHHIAGSLHADDMVMTYLPKEKLLIEADAYTPPAPNAQPMTPPNPFTVNLVENIGKQKLAVDQVLPLHGRVVPVAELMKAAGHSH